MVGDEWNVGGGEGVGGLLKGGWNSGGVGVGEVGVGLVMMMWVTPVPLLVWCRGDDDDDARAHGRG